MLTKAAILSAIEAAGLTRKFEQALEDEAQALLDSTNRIRTPGRKAQARMDAEGYYLVDISTLLESPAVPLTPDDITSLRRKPLAWAIAEAIRGPLGVRGLLPLPRVPTVRVVLGVPHENMSRKLLRTLAGAGSVEIRDLSGTDDTRTVIEIRPPASLTHDPKAWALVVTEALASAGFNAVEAPEWPQTQEEPAKPWRVRWDNGHASGALPGKYATEAEARRAGMGWKADLVAHERGEADRMATRRAYTWEAFEE